MQVKEAIDRINDDIVEIIGHFIELKQHGRNYQGCCPFHNEKTPSFVVSPAKGIYKCFGCQKGGDSISFIMEHDKLEFIDALKVGAKKLNLEVNWNEQKRDFNEEDYKRKEALRIICRKAAEYFQACLKDSKVASDYLVERKFETDIADPFMLGYAPAGNTLQKWAGENNISAGCFSSSLRTKHIKDREYSESLYNDIPEQGSEVKAQCNFSILTKNPDVLLCIFIQCDIVLDVNESPFKVIQVLIFLIYFGCGRNVVVQVMVTDDPVVVSLSVLAIKDSVAPCPKSFFLPTQLGDFLAALGLFIEQSFKSVKIGLRTIEPEISLRFNMDLEGR